MPYELNEFSFQDEGTFKDWMLNRPAAQKRKLRTVWLDLEWFSRSNVFANAQLFGKHCGLKHVKISKMAVRRLANTMANLPDPFYRHKNFLDTQCDGLRNRVLRLMGKEDEDVTFEFLD